jgi:hypothetical protein
MMDEKKKCRKGRHKTDNPKEKGKCWDPLPCVVCPDYIEEPERQGIWSTLFDF